MKKLTILLVFLIAFTAFGWGQIISQYIETDSGTIPKGIEIWNNTSTILDFSVNNLVIKKGTNGGTPAPDYTLNTGTLDIGDVIVIGTSDMETTTIGNGSSFHLKAFTFNGDDALEVWFGSVKTDVFGEPGVDPGSAWTGGGVSTKDQNIQIKTGITSGDPDGWSDPSLRFETVNTNPSGSNGDEGFGVAPVIASGPDNPTSFSATTNSTSQIDLAWLQNTASDDVMVAWTMDDTFGVPADGTSYSASDVITGGGTVIYNGSALLFNHASLTSGTQYYYKAWSVDGSVAYSSGVTDDATTYKEEPTNHVTTFMAGTGTPSSSVIDLVWDDATGGTLPDGYLIKGSSVSYADITAPADGIPEVDGGLVLNVAQGTKFASFTGLSSSTTYYFKIWPYTNTADAIDYKTDGTVPEASEATTGFATTIPYAQTFDTDLGDCQTYNVSGSTKEWSWVSGGYAGMNGYDSGDLEEDWLFIPGINFDDYSNEFMTFDSWYNYGTDDADNYLKLMYSVDYTGSGDPTSATWIEISFAKPSASSTWTSSGTIDLSAISGTSVFIAFKYHYSSGNYRSWELDNISIQESSVDPEPTNYPTAFDAIVNSSSAITNNWVDAIGAQLPSGYLILANLTGNFSGVVPVDGTPVSDDTDLSDGEGAMNIAQGSQTYQWAGLDQSTQYYFTIYPYSNTAATIDYKTDGTPPTADATTTIANLDLIISEVTDPKDVYKARFIELYNLSSSTIDFDTDDWYLCRQTNGGTTWEDKKLTGSVAAGNAYVAANNNGSTTDDFYVSYGFMANFDYGGSGGNGNDGYFLYHNGDHSTGNLIDAYGVIDQDGSGQPWEYLDTKAVRIRSVGSPNTIWTASEWDIPTEANVVNMTPGQDFNYVSWLGTTDTDWNTKANWDNGFIPDASMIITVSFTANNPIVGGEAACYDLTLSSNAELSVSPAVPITIYGNLSVATSKSRTAASFTIDSDAAVNGSVIVMGTATGNTTVKRYFNQYTSAADGWHYIGSPVDDMTISGSDFVPGAHDDLFSWDEDDYLWRNYLGSYFGYTTFENGIGFMVAFENDVTKSFVGTLNTSDVTHSNLSLTPTKGDGWHLLGNPYASAIKWNDGNWTLTSFGGVAKVYDESAGTYSDVAANGIIPSTNGFFVQVSSATNSITIPAASRVHDATNNYKSTLTEMDETLKLLVNNDANNFSDRTTIGFRDDAELSFDWAFDSHKMFGQATAPQLWTLIDGEQFSTNNLPPVYENMELPLNFKAGVTSTYHIIAEGIESFYLNSEIYLEDVQAGITINLRDEPMYTFAGQPSDDNARFVLHFFGVTSVSDIDKNKETIIYGNAKTIFVKTEVLNTNYHIDVYDIMGKKILSDNFVSTSLNTFKLYNKRGVYIVKLQSAHNQYIEKINLR